MAYSKPASKALLIKSTEEEIRDLNQYRASRTVNTVHCTKLRFAKIGSGYNFLWWRASRSCIQSFSKLLKFIHQFIQQHVRSLMYDKVVSWGFSITIWDFKLGSGYNFLWWSASTSCRQKLDFSKSLKFFHLYSKTCTLITWGFSVNICDFKAILCLETAKFGREGVENHYEIL